MRLETSLGEVSGSAGAQLQAHALAAAGPLAPRALEEPGGLGRAFVNLHESIGMPMSLMPE